MCTITLNNDFKGIELSFESKPEAEVLTAIKSNGFRWHNGKKVWYAKQSEQTLTFANTLKELETLPVVEQVTTIKDTFKKENKTVVKKLSKSNLSLFESTRWNEETTNVNKSLSIKEIAAIVRKSLRERFPLCKLSVTSSSGNLYVEIKESPYNVESEELKAIAHYCYQYANSFKYCTSHDPYGDYGSSYNFYGVYENNIVKDYDYTQKEQTEAILLDITDFESKIEQLEIEEEAKKESEFTEFLKSQAIKEAEYKEKESETDRQVKAINENVKVIDLSETEKYIVVGSQFAHINKNSTLDQYKEEVKANEFYLQNVEITKEVHFQTVEALEYFSNLLLNNFDFIANTGGTRTEDSRINSMIDFNNMTEEERKTVEFISCDSVAVYYNQELQFVIDAQGYSFARYVGLVEDVTIQKQYTFKQLLTPEQVEEYKTQAETLENISTEVITNNNIIDTWKDEKWNVYKDGIKEQLKKCNFKLGARVIQQLETEELKVPMYKLLVEVDGIQDQFKDAELQQGEKITLFYIGDMGGLITSHIIYDKFENTSYAQHRNAIKLIYKQPRKKGLYGQHFYSDMLVYRGWQELDQNVLYNDQSENEYCTITTGRFSSCDKNQYDVIINYLLTQDQKPVINTYKPIF